MFVKIALRNIFRNPKSSLLITLFIAFMAMLFMLSGSLVSTIQTGLRKSFRSNITGDFVVMPKSDVAMSLFGANVPEIGEFFDIPSLKEHDALLEKINSLPNTEDTISQVSGSAIMDANGRRYPVPFFGINFREHFSFFPAIRIIAGALPAEGEYAIMISSAAAQKIGRETKKPVKPGTKIKLSTLGPDGFKIREFAVSGIYAFSGSGPVIDSVVLIDTRSARALNSILTSEFAANIEEDNTDLIDNDIEYLFGDEDSLFSGNNSMGNDSMDDDTSVFSLLEEVSAESRKDNNTEAANGSWQFIIIKAKPGTDKAAYYKNLKQQLAGFDADITDWRKAAGSSTMFAWILQLLFSVSLVIILVTGITGITNLMFTSYFSRIREIGTIRAIGGQKKTVVRLFLYEYSIISLAGGLAGMMAAVLLTALINGLGIHISNSILQMMIGSDVFRFAPSAGSAVLTIVLALVTGIVSSLVPLSRAIGVRPVFAMEGGIS